MDTREDPSAPGGPPRVPIEAWRRQVRGLLGGLGLEDAEAEVTADVLVAADLMGIDSHGAACLSLYERLLGEGGAVARRRIQVVRQGGATALLDAGGGLGHVPTVQAVEMAAERAETLGLGAVAVRNSSHYGAAGVYARRLAERGLVGLCTSSVWEAATVPTRGLAPRFGTNPMAFAAPCEGGPPFLLDMATSTAAIGKIKLRHRAGERLPEGWALTPEGAPQTDPVAALAHTLLVPLGGHKGYGLAAMVEILSAALSGALLTPVEERRGRPHDVGHLVIALDPAAFRDTREAFAADVAAMARALRATPPADPAAPVLVAGDPEHAAEADRLASGVPLPPAFAAELRALSERLGVPFVLQPEDATT